MNSIDLGHHNIVKEVPSPKTYLVKTGRRYLHGLEDGEIRYWPETHTIMINEATGEVVIRGGYGVFSYCWPSPNRGKDRSLHGFLYNLSFDYFMNKASTQPYMVADIEATYESMKKDILKERRRGWIKKETARKLWDEMETDLNDSMSEEEFVAALYNNPDLCEHYCDGGPSIISTEHQGMRNFWDEVWEVFRAEILAPYARADREKRENRAA